MTKEFGENIVTLEQRLKERVKLWEDIVKESIFSEEVKKHFLSVIEDRLKKGKRDNESVEDWVYYSINMLLNVAAKVIKEYNLSENDVMSLFQNLRDDIWDFYKEIK